jgi:hypothetical protein
MFECRDATGSEYGSYNEGWNTSVHQKCHNLYGRRNTQGEEAAVTTPLEDPRQACTVPTMCYELYWIWILHYSKHSWIMMIDARDTVFQKNPFDLLCAKRTRRNTKGWPLDPLWGEFVLLYSIAFIVFSSFSASVRRQLCLTSMISLYCHLTLIGKHGSNKNRGKQQE